MEPEVTAITDGAGAKREINPFRSAPVLGSAHGEVVTPARKLRATAEQALTGHLTRPSKGSGALLTWLILVILLGPMVLVPILHLLHWPMQLSFVPSYAAVPMLLLINHFRPLTVSDSKLTLEVWQKEYAADFEVLQNSELPLYIATDEMWMAILDSGTANTAKYAFGLPKSSSDRLIYATAFWEALLAYQRGERRDFSQDLIARRAIVQQLYANSAALRSGHNSAWLARFCALYDFFYGEQE